MVTALYAGLLALMQTLLTTSIIQLRFKHNVKIGDGKIEELTRRIRVHGNFIETVPIALILLFMLEYQGLRIWQLHALGGLLLAGRIAHAYGLQNKAAHPLFRRGGMAVTLSVIAIAGLTNIIYALT